MASYDKVTTAAVAESQPEMLALVKHAEDRARNGLEIKTELAKYLVVQKGFDLHLIEDLRQTPQHQPAKRTFFDLASLAHYVTELKVIQPMAWYTPLAKDKPLRGTLRVVLNPRRANLGDWEDHVAIYPLEWTSDWTAWSGLADKLVGRAAFAEFIEDHVHNIAEPAAAKFLQAIRNLRLSSKSEFTSIQETNLGVQVSFRKDVTNENSALALPDTFELLLSPLEGEPAIRLVAELRYRLDSNQGGVAFGFRFPNLEKILRDYEESHLASIAKALGLAILRGDPALAANLLPEPKRVN